jgi:hypothetical protein
LLSSRGQEWWLTQLKTILKSDNIIKFGSQERNMSNHCWDISALDDSQVMGEGEGEEGRVGREGETAERRGSKYSITECYCRTFVFCVQSLLVNLS